jgi:hypothetical protein
MDVSSVKQPAGREKLPLGRRSVTRGKVPRGWNSTGPPRASQMATLKREPWVRERYEGVGGGIFFVCAGFFFGSVVEGGLRSLDLDLGKNGILESLGEMLYLGQELFKRLCRVDIAQAEGPEGLQRSP